MRRCRRLAALKSIDVFKRAGGPMIARPFLLFGFLILAAISSASESSSLLSHARKVGLGQNPEWLRLGHWKRGRFSRHWVSDAGDTFFLSPRGGA
jgi:hypothetical protein